MSLTEAKEEIETKWRKAINWFFSDEKDKQTALTQLNKFWINIQSLTESELNTIEQITWLSRCNWNFENSIMSIIEAIGKKTKSKVRIGHKYSITEERWKKVWAYYLTLKEWLPSRDRFSGLNTILSICDPKSEVQNNIQKMLGERNELKELYVELFCYFFEFHIMGMYPEVSGRRKANDAAKKIIIDVIKKRNYDEMLLAAVQIDPESLSENTLHWYEPCHSKFFRRCDITISSIGVEKWRGAIPVNGKDGKKLTELFDEYILGIDSWLKGKDYKLLNPLSKKIVDFLGNSDSNKTFIVSLLNSFLKGQRE